MATHLSSGLVNKLLAVGSFKSIFNNGWLDLYTGVQPADANNAVTGDLILTFSSSLVAEVGLHWDDVATNGILAKDPNEIWSGVSLINATAGWFRLREAGDTGLLASLTAARWDGSVGIAYGQLTLRSNAFVAGNRFVLRQAHFMLPRASN